MKVDLTEDEWGYVLAGLAEAESLYAEKERIYKGYPQYCREYRNWFDKVFGRISEQLKEQQNED